MLAFHELLALMVCGASLKDVVIERFLVRRRGGLQSRNRDCLFNGPS